MNSSGFQSALSSSSHDVLDVSSKLGVLSAIQHDLAAHHGKAVFVTAVLVSWPTTLNVSWVSGGFAGGATVVLLSDRTSAVVLLAGSKYGSSGASATGQGQQQSGGATTPATGGTHSAQQTNSAASGAAAAAASMAFRVVAVICASEIIAHNFIAVEHLHACIRNTTNSAAHSGATSTSAVPPSAAVAIPRFCSVSLAFCTILERARYVMIERSPPAALVRLFCEIRRDVMPPHFGESSAGPQTGLMVAPLGSITSLAVALAATVGPDDAIVAADDRLFDERVTVQFSSLSTFRIASLARVMKSSTVTFAAALRSKRDLGALASSAAAIETLWCLAGSRSVYFSADVNVRAAVYREIAPIEYVIDGPPGSPQPSSSLQQRQQQQRGAVGVTSSTTSGVFPPGGGGSVASPTNTSASGTSAATPAASVLPQQLDTKERSIAVVDGGIVLLKKKSAFPPPLWCTAISWNLVSRLILNPKTFASISSDATNSMEDTLAPASSVSGLISKDPEVAPLSVTVYVRSRSTWGPSELNGTISATSSGGDVEEVFTIAFSVTSALIAFVFACRDSYVEFTNGRVLPVLPHGAEFQTAWLPIPVAASTLTSATPPKTTPLKGGKASASPARGSGTQPASGAPSTTGSTSATQMCMLWPAGSDVDTPRRYPQQLFTIANLSSASSTVATSSMALASLEHLLTETPTAFIMGVQYIFLWNAPRLWTDLRHHEVGTTAAVVDASGASEVPEVPNALKDEDAHDDDVGARRMAREDDTPMPLIVPILSAIASSVVQHFALLPAVSLGGAAAASNTIAEGRPHTNAAAATISGRMGEVFLAAVTFDACLRSSTPRPSTTFPFMPMDALEQMVRRFGRPEASSSGAGSPSFAFLVCRWVVATSLRDMFQAIRRWATAAHRRHLAEPKPAKAQSPREEADDDDAAARVRSFSALPEGGGGAPQPEAAIRRLSSAKASSPLSSSVRRREQLQQQQSRRFGAEGGAAANTQDWRSTASAVGLDADAVVPLGPADILRMYVHRITSGAAFNMLLSHDQSGLMRDAVAYRDSWRPRLLTLLRIIQSTLHSASGGSAFASSESLAASSPGATTSAGRLLSVMLLDILIDLAVHQHAAANQFYSGDATTTAYEYSANALRHGLLRTTATGSSPRGGAPHPVARQILEAERSMLEWLRTDAPPVAVASWSSSGGPSPQPHSSSPSSPHAGGEVSPSSPLGGSVADSHMSAGSIMKGGGGAAASARSQTFSLRSLMQQVERLDEELLHNAYNVATGGAAFATGRVTGYRGGGSSQDMWGVFVGKHVAFRWSPASGTAGAPMDASPLTRLHRYLSSGVPGSGGTLWHELLQALTTAHMSINSLKHLSHSMSLVVLGPQAHDALMLRRDGSTQTLRTSAQEAKLLEEHLSLRSQILLNPTNAAAAHTTTHSSEQSFPSHTKGTGSGGARSPFSTTPPSVLHTPTARSPPALSSPPNGVIPPQALTAVVDDDNNDYDIETNKNLMRRVLRLEHQLLDAHGRNATLQELLNEAQQRNTNVAAAHAAEWDLKLLKHVQTAQSELQRERLLFLVEKEAGQREIIVSREAKGWFELTSGLLLAMMAAAQHQQLQADKDRAVKKAKGGPASRR